MCLRISSHKAKSCWHIFINILFNLTLSCLNIPSEQLSSHLWINIVVNILKCSFQVLFRHILWRLNWSLKNSICRLNWFHMSHMALNIWIEISLFEVFLFWILRYNLRESVILFNLTWVVSKITHLIAMPIVQVELINLWNLRLRWADDVRLSKIWWSFILIIRVTCNILSPTISVFDLPNLPFLQVQVAIS